VVAKFTSFNDYTTETDAKNKKLGGSVLDINEEQMLGAAIVAPPQILTC